MRLPWLQLSSSVLLACFGALCLILPAAASQGGEAGTDPAVSGSADDGAGGSFEAAGAGGNAVEDMKNQLESGVRGLLNDPSGTLKRWALEDGPPILGRVLLFLLMLMVSRVVARFAGRVMRGAVERSAKHASELLKSFIESSVRKVVFSIGVVLALQNLGIDIAPLLAGIGVLGFVVGFALQDTLGNFAAGIMLLMYRPFDVGDFVEVGGREGTVEAMTLVSTTLLTLDNQRLTIPNGKIWGDVIRNVTANPERRINETIGIGYGDDVDRATAVALEVLGELEAVHAEPEPQVLLTSLGDSSVNLSLRAWVATGDYFATCCELRRRIKLRFDAEAISIPYPQRDVHLIREEA